MEKIFDLRSDTLTRPDEAMRKAMYEAEVGDDVFSEDPTVNKLQEYCAELFGKEAALFVSSGVMGNQLCLRIQCVPGDEVICEKYSHIFNYESGSPAALSGIQLFPIDGPQGIMPIDSIIESIRPRTAYYMPKSKLVTLENTHNRYGGAVVPFAYIQRVRQIAQENGLKTHLDGARIWNASVATGISVKEYAGYFDTVSACFSKGLGAPVGSIIVGSREFIYEARRIRKSWGGGMRQSGILAAAALYALQNNVERLKEDHDKIALLMNELEDIKNVVVSKNEIPTNILLFEIPGVAPALIIEQLKLNGILVLAGTYRKVRIVAHKDISLPDMKSAIKIICAVVRSITEK